LLSMLGAHSQAAPILDTQSCVAVIVIVGAIVLTHVLMRARTLELVVAQTHSWLLGLIWGVMAFAIVIAQGSGSAFIYFQF